MTIRRKAGFAGSVPDACKVLVKPYQQVAEHHHVVCEFISGAAVSKFQSSQIVVAPCVII